ncbi:sugar phosphate isomerase/epimerase family protein [Bacillus solitudinis]|uniref:sugar phosphate isomerase/epimerase family protein n=1 Tax=Bacillus solitudinis TaxID=2014074 RepID=UPI000C237939|nr:sugar phosphate isomerase/epimerase family protein [Bacillus solitudinis]
MYPFKTAINTSTLFPFKLGIDRQIEVAANAGYDGIELWMNDVEAFLEIGTIQQLKQIINSTNIELVNAIAFFKWIDADVSIRKQAFEQAKNYMYILSELGCKAIAAPPFGQINNVKYEEIAEAFSELVSLGRKMGVEPYLEFWGKAKKISTVGEALYLAAQSGVSDAKIILDPFHMHTGGSPLTSMNYIKKDNIGVFHVNDFPATPDRLTIEDNNRLFPGQGILKTEQIASILNDIGYKGYLSLELFIDSYGEKSADEVAEFGLKCVKESFQVS